MLFSYKHALEYTPFTHIYHRHRADSRHHQWHQCELSVNFMRSGVSGKAKLVLKLNDRHAGHEAGNEISSPKPCRERHMGALHDRIGNQGCIPTTLPAAQHAWPSFKAERF